MSFASPLFLWYFLPGLLVLYWVFPGRFRNLFVSVASLGLYSVGGGSFVVGLLAMMAVNFSAGIALDSEALRARPGARKALLVATVLADLSVLAVWKYAGFAAEQAQAVSELLDGPAVPAVQLALPIGISFFTFHHISYVVDVYRHSRHAQKSPVQFATYIAMFPQLVAGPIVTRRAPRATCSSRPIASSTWLGCGTPAEQADPVEHSMPRWSRSIKSESPSHPGKVRWA